jgi:predicted dehydrogenase
MRSLQLGMLGGGPGSFIGFTHRLAAKMDEEFALVGGVFSSDYAKSVKFARSIDLDVKRVYRSVDELIERERALPVDGRMTAVTIATPNYLHYDAARKLIRAGFHVICDKPVTLTCAEAERLEKMVGERGTVFCLTHNYTGYPMVREARKLIEKGTLGRIQKIDVQYYMGAFNPLVHDKKNWKNIWRFDPFKAGISCNVADLGTHAFNLVEYITQIEVKAVLADLNTLYDGLPLDLDATILLRLGGNLKGVLRSSHIATGEENALEIKIYGDKMGLRWEEENPNYLYLLSDNKPAQVYSRGKSSNTKFSLEGTRVYRGLPEGFFESFGNLYKGAAKAIRTKRETSGAFPTIHDGVRTMKFVEAAVSSHKKGNKWVELR